MKIRLRLAGLTLLILGTALALPTTLLAHGVRLSPTLFAQDKTQKADCAEASFELPATWSVFNLRAPDVKALIEQKVADKSIDADMGKSVEGSVDKNEFKISAVAPKEEVAFTTNVNLIVDKEPGDLKDQQAGIVARAEKNGDEVKLNEITEENPHLHFVKVVRKEGAVPYMIDQVIFKSGETVYALTFGYPEVDGKAMAEVVSQAIKTFEIKPSIQRRSR